MSEYYDRSGYNPEAEPEREPPCEPEDVPGYESAAWWEEWRRKESRLAKIRFMPGNSNSAGRRRKRGQC